MDQAEEKIHEAKARGENWCWLITEDYDFCATVKEKYKVLGYDVYASAIYADKDGCLFSITISW